MSNEVYGFAEFERQFTSFAEVVERVRFSTGLGFHQLNLTDLYGFPKDCEPGSGSIVFSITDRPGSNNATYLIDFLDYTEEAQIGLPTSGSARINLLFDVIDLLFDEYYARRVCVAITDSSQIEDRKKLDQKSFRRNVIEDFETLSPPCCLYDIYYAIRNRSHHDEQ